MRELHFYVETHHSQLLYPALYRSCRDHAIDLRGLLALDPAPPPQDVPRDLIDHVGLSLQLELQEGLDNCGVGDELPDELAGRPVHDGLAEVLLLKLAELYAQLHSHHRVAIGPGQQRNLADFVQFEESIEGKRVYVVVWLHFLRLLLVLLRFALLLLLGILQVRPLLHILLFLFDQRLDGRRVPG